MKKFILSVLIAILLLNIVIADVSATTVFLTSDNIVDEDTDKSILYSIKSYIEDLSNGNIKVVVDPQAPSPGEGTRAILADEDVRIVMSACCAGNFGILAKYAAGSDNQVIFVNTGDFDLDSENNLRRAWDDNYSNSTFAGYNDPGKFLNESGITYIQPVKKFSEEFPDGILNEKDDEVCKYIAQEIIESINNYNSSQSKTVDNSLLVSHKLPVYELSKGSSKLYASMLDNTEDISFNGYTAPQLLYLTSSYLNGNGLESPDNFEEPSSPLKVSLFAKESYNIYDYMKMGGIVKNYMDEHHQAPNYIEYDGAYISYYDLLYNFAKITKNHTDMRNMDFEQSYTFEKVNDSVLIALLPFLLIGIVILIIVILIRKINKRRRYRR